MIYLYIAAAIAFAAVSGYAYVQQERAGKFKAEVAACETARVAMGEQIKQQNAAVDSLKAEADARAATSAAALRKAEGRAKVWDSQAKRLQAILASRKPGQTECKAAWGEIRGGK